MTWLASWTENIQNQIKYVMLNPSSRLKGEKDMEKYEKARRLKDKIVKIREDYSSGKEHFRAARTEFELWQSKADEGCYSWLGPAPVGP